MRHHFEDFQNFTPSPPIRLPDEYTNLLLLVYSRATGEKHASQRMQVKVVDARCPELLVYLGSRARVAPELLR